MAHSTNNPDRSRRLQTSTRRPIYIPEREIDPKATRRKLQSGRRGYVTPRHQLVIGQLAENGRNGRSWGEILVAAGYSPNTAKAPSKVTGALGFMELLEEVLPDEELHAVHKELLHAKKMDHMVFPLGPKGEDDINFSGGAPTENPIEQAGIHVERTTLTDTEITALLASVGGTVRRIVHGETARHVYFWAPNPTPRLQALKLAYEVKGYIGKRAEDGPPAGGNTYNTFIQQNNIDPNAPDAKQLVEDTLGILMERTKASVKADSVN